MTTAPSDRAAVVRRLKNLAKRYDRAVATVERLERERAVAYQEARECDPPITFRQIADIFKVTEAAVMQKLKRETNPKMKGSPKAKAPAS